MFYEQFFEEDIVLSLPQGEEQGELEEDEDGIPIKYRDKIMAMSKETNRNIAQRWRADLCKDEVEDDSNF